MNFYSEDTINNIIDTEEIENIIPKIDKFREDIVRLFCNYSRHVICPLYIISLLKDETNKIVFRCIDTVFTLENCPSILIYHTYIDKSKNEIIYYILMICTKNKFKKFGYASNLLDDFIKYIKDKITTFKKIKIVLSSVETAVTFYESYGFRWTRESLTEHDTLMRYERYEEDKEYFILELII